MKLAEALLQGLLDHGVQQLFGIPGDFALPLFKATQAWGKLPLHTLSHEPAVGFAADAAARIASAPAAALVTYGAGALNMLNAVASAYAEQVPLVVDLRRTRNARRSRLAQAAPPGQDARLATRHFPRGDVRPGAPRRPATRARGDSRACSAAA